jgi:hypothetical protein
MKGTGGSVRGTPAEDRFLKARQVPSGPKTLTMSHKRGGSMSKSQLNQLRILFNEMIETK